MFWDALATIAALPVLAVSAYLAVLAAAARNRPSAAAGRSTLRFDVIIPAHNEEIDIADTVRSVLAMDYPPRLFRVLVVADNCTDRTAEVAADAGAQVLVRHAPALRGKGYALGYALERTLADGFADAAVVIDADSVVSANLLAALSAHIASGARALQVDYGVRNPESSWRTRLMHLAFTAFHTLRSLARERFGVSCGLRGNGMAFTTDLLRAVPPRAFSIVEDVEYGIALGLAGVRVRYVAEAQVRGTMCDGETSSRSQRRRWEQGRSALAKQYAVRLLIESLRRRDPLLLDLAVDLIVPPLGTIAAVVASGILACGLAVLSGVPLRLAPWLWTLSAAGLAMYVGRALALSGTGWRGLVDLLQVPAYVVWKLLLPVLGRARGSEEWVRTARERSS